KGGGMVAEAALLRRAVPRGALVCVLDERGTVEPSPGFAKRLGGWRDAGRGDVALLIGGADGLDPDLRAGADHALSFGAMVWPHMLVRVMLAEQLYRAASILSGGPYHRA
ncbi:MAG: 23S rRNA (pseudouridine(1915)-N(3))-methyltransferase RlmH, partial [Pseudomonadota bacterium]